jgi:hypothetical protein
MSSLPTTTESIRTEFTDRYNYFRLCSMVARAADADKPFAAAYLRKAMVILGYPQETASWDDARTITYAQNIVMMG